MHQQWSLLFDSNTGREILTIDAHTEGEPLRVILSGFPDLSGTTILERRREAREQWDHLRRARRDGLATLLISADLDELIGLSDRIAVMFRGRLVAFLDPNDVTPRDLGAYMTGATLGQGEGGDHAEPSTGDDENGAPS